MPRCVQPTWLQETGATGQWVGVRLLLSMPVVSVPADSVQSGNSLNPYPKPLTLSAKPSTLNLNPQLWHASVSAE